MNYYYFETEADGLCEYSTKKAAINNASKALTDSGYVDVCSPSGTIVATVSCRRKNLGYYA